MKRFWFLGLTGLGLAVLGANCLPPGGNTNKPRVAALRGFRSAEELRTYLASQAQARYRTSTGLFGLPLFSGSTGGAAPTAADTTAGTGSENSQGESGSSDPFSTTTIQEAGVDESDIVKTDGQFIYVLDGNTIHIVQATPPEGLVELSTIDIEASGDSLYLRGDKLIALSRYDNYYYYLDQPVAMGGGGTAVGVAPPSQATPVIGATFKDGVQTTVTVINVSDPAAPSVEATVRLEGSLASSRLIDNLLYLVVTATPHLPDNPTPAAIGAMRLEDWIPNFEVVAPDGSTQSGDIAGWQGFYRPENPDGYGITAVVTLDVNSPTTPFKSTAISANAGVIYASIKALYVTDTSYDYTSSTSRSDTAVHKLAFTPEGTAYVGSGLVPGRLLNQYSLGEYKDYLRLATTVEEYDPTVGVSRQDNNVYVLGESDGSLAVVGQVEGLAPGEQIYSARFVGPRGFLVTFRRVDPLFTLDLTDPTKPTVAGELVVPGYSDFILPMDENHLLTIGKGAQDAGSFAWIQGIKLAIFDVTDLAHPALLWQEPIGGRGSDSEANRNPKAFNYFAAKNALAFPANVYEMAGGGASYGMHDFTGLYVYRVTVADGFQLLGKIASSENPSQGGCFYGYYGFTRGVFIGDTVYSVTQREVKAASLAAVGTIVGDAALSGASALTADCFGVPQIILPAGTGLE